MDLDDRIKKYLKITGIFIMLVLSYTALSFAASYSRSIDPASLRSFSVSGEGKVVSIPNVAQFSFSIVTEGGVNVAELQKENTNKANKVIDFVKSNGVEEKDIKTQNYNIEPRYQYFSCNNRILTSEPKPCPPSEIVGYTIRQTLFVKIRDFDKTGDILSGVVISGANNISSLSFTIDDEKAVQKEARNVAIKEARDKAKEIAKAAKFRLGDIISINEGFSSPIVRYGIGGETAMSFKDTGALAPSIEPGSQDVVINITIQYEIR